MSHTNQKPCRCHTCDRLKSKFISTHNILLIISGKTTRLRFVSLIYKQNFFIATEETVFPKPLKVKVNLSSKKGIAVVTWDRKDEFQIHFLKKGFSTNEKRCASKLYRSN